MCDPVKILFQASFEGALSIIHWKSNNVLLDVNFEDDRISVDYLRTVTVLLSGTFDRELLKSTCQCSKLPTKGPEPSTSIFQPESSPLKYAATSDSAPPTSVGQSASLPPISIELDQLSRSHGKKPSLLLEYPMYFMDTPSNLPPCSSAKD